MNLPLEQSRPHFNGILLKLRFRRENRANASVTQAKGAVCIYMGLTDCTYQRDLATSRVTVRGSL